MDITMTGRDKFPIATQILQECQEQLEKAKAYLNKAIKQIKRWLIGE